LYEGYGGVSLEQIIIHVTEEAPGHVSIIGSFLIFAIMLITLVINRKKMGCMAPIIIGVPILMVVVAGSRGGIPTESTSYTTLVLQSDSLQIETLPHQAYQLKRGDIIEMHVDDMLFGGNAKVILFSPERDAYSFIASKKQIPLIGRKLSDVFQLSETSPGSHRWQLTPRK
jgi:hypothetical protein